MKLSALICTLGLLLAAAPTGAVEVVNLSAYPFSTPVRASVSSVFLGGYAPDFPVHSLEVRPDRSQVEFFEGRHQLPVGFLAQPTSTRLLIVIPGLGGDAQSGMATYLAGKAWQWGYNVLTLPNPLSWRFALGASREGYPGYTPFDVLDLLPLIKKSLKRFKKQYGVNVKSVSILGYSLGGLHAAHLATRIEKDLGLPLERVALINSPVDVLESATVVDKLYALGAKFSEAHIANIFGQLLQFFDLAGSHVPVPEYALFTSVERALKISDRDLSWVIGFLFREDLTGVLYVSQQVKERGVLKSPITWGRRTLRQQEARQFTFQRYMSEVVAPWVQDKQPALTLPDIINRAGLLPLSEKLQQDQRFIFFHTTDDFLTTPASQNWARDTFGGRAIYYDRGGHLGQVWTQEFQADLARALSPSKF